MDRLAAMATNEHDIYNYPRFLPSHLRQHSSLQRIVDPDWRASIVKWARNILNP